MTSGLRLLRFRRVATHDDAADKDDGSSETCHDRVGEELANRMACRADLVPDPVHSVAEPAASGNLIELIDREFEVREVLIDRICHSISPVLKLWDYPATADRMP